VVWRDVGQRLLDDGCRIRTGRHEEDGRWLQPEIDGFRHTFDPPEFLRFFGAD
jgi:hypothetical protein